MSSRSLIPIRSPAPPPGAAPHIPRARLTAGAGAGAGGGAGGIDDISDASLLSSMTKRLGALERLVSAQSADIRQRDAVVAQLRQRCERLESAGADETAIAQIEQLQRENRRVKRQLFEMENFLHDYGLIWVGFRDGDDAEADGESATAAPSGAASSSEALADALWFDMARMKVSIDDLNASIENAAKMNIVNEHGVHRFKREQFATEPLVFFKNGIFFRNGPLRPYSLADTRAFCDDILDGYFPFELKDAYPDGLVFKIQDRTHEACASPFARLDRLANGHVVGGSGGGSTSGSGSGSESAAESAAPTDAALVAPPPSSVSSAQLLQRLPAQVVRNGQVLAIRTDAGGAASGGVGSALGQGQGQGQGQESGGMLVVPTEALRRLQDDPSLAAEIATLRVKFADAAAAGAPAQAQRPLLLKLHFDDLVGTLRRHIAESVQAAAGFKLELRTTFPNRVYADDEVTLRAAGLTPNALLLVRLAPHA